MNPDQTITIEQQEEIYHKWSEEVRYLLAMIVLSEDLWEVVESLGLERLHENLPVYGDRLFHQHSSHIAKMLMEELADARVYGSALLENEKEEANDDAS